MAKIRSVPDLLVGVLVAAAVQVEVLPHPGPVSLLAAGVVLELALVRPPPQQSHGVHCSCY